MNLRAANISSSGPGCVTARGPGLSFAYHLDDALWLVEGVSGNMIWTCAARSRVRLVDPLGAGETRDTASAALISCRQERAGNGSVWRFQVIRGWPDGLIVRQQFTLSAVAPDLQIELALRTPRRYSLAVQSLDLLAAPPGFAENLLACSWHEGEDDPDVRGQDTTWRLLDFGWSTAEAARVIALTNPEPVEATGLMALGRADNGVLITLGFYPGDAVAGTFRIAGSSRPGAMRLEASSAFDALDLRPAGVTGGPLWLSAARLPDALVRYVHWWHREAPSAVRPTLAAWSLSAPGERTAERTVLDRLHALLEVLHDPAVDAALIDRGWEEDAGDWTPDRERFPRGLRAIADIFRSRGLRPGIGLAPALVARSSRTFREHATWLVRSPDGAPVLVSEPDLFVLDATNGPVIDWLRAIGRRPGDEWAFEVILLDMLEALTVAGWRAGGFCSPAAMYRRALRALRAAAMGRLLLAGDAPIQVTLGDVDGMLVASRPVSRAEPSALLRAFLAQSGTPVGVRAVVDDPGQTIDEIRAAATIACLSGGIALFGGDPRRLPPERIAVIQSCIPPFNQGSVLPLDPFAPDGPTLFGCSVHRPWGDWFLLVVLNPTETPIARTIALRQLPLAPGCYDAFEFWSQSYLGSVSEYLVLEHIAPGGCAVVALHPERVIPRVIGTSLHLTMGAVELQGVQFVASACRLHLAIGAAGRRDGRITLAIPRGWSPGPIRGTGGSFTARQPTAGLVEVAVHFQDVAEVEVEFWPRGARR
jgi:hypothetical protein